MVNGVKRPWWWWAPRRPGIAWGLVLMFGVGCLLDVFALTSGVDDPGWRLLFACIFGAGALSGALSLTVTKRVTAWEQREF